MIYSEDHKSITTYREYCYITLDVVASLDRLGIVQEKAYTIAYNDIIAVLEKLSNIYDDVKIIETNDRERTIVWRQRYYPRSLLQVYTPDWKPKVLEFLSKSINELREHGLIHSDLAMRNIMVDDNDGMHLIDLDSIILFEGRDNSILFGYIQHDLSMTKKEFLSAIGWRRRD